MTIPPLSSSGLFGAIPALASREREVNQLRQRLNRATGWLRVVDLCVAEAKSATQVEPVYEAWAKAVVSNLHFGYVGIFDKSSGTTARRITAQGHKKLAAIDSLVLDQNTLIAVPEGIAIGDELFSPSSGVTRSEGRLV